MRTVLDRGGPPPITETTYAGNGEAENIGTTIGARLAQTFQSLRHRDFRLYWFGVFFSYTGRWAHITTQGWLVYDLTGSAMLLGTVGFVQTLPMLFLSPLGGVFADRFSKRKLLLVTQFANMVITLSMAALVSSGYAEVWHVLVLAGLTGTVMAFDMPTQYALVPALVSREDMPNAIALYSTVFHGTRIWGPMLAGLLIAPIGMGGTFYVASLGFIPIIAALLMLHVPAAGGAARRHSVLRNLADGFHYIRRIPVVLLVVLLAAIFSLFGTSFRSLMPVFAGQVLQVGPEGLGWLMAISGAGALVGALWMASLKGFGHSGWLLLTSSITRGATLVWFALSRVFSVSLISMALAGFTESINMTVMNTMLQALTTDEMRGRVMSAYTLTSTGLVPLASLIGGALAQSMGAPFAIAIGGVVCTLAPLVIGVVAPSLRRAK